MMMASRGARRVVLYAVCGWTSAQLHCWAINIPQALCRVAGSQSSSSKPVNIEDFHRLGCENTYEYFRDLDALPRQEYLALRDQLSWDRRFAISATGGEPTREESFDIGNEIKVIRQYHAHDITVLIDNRSSYALFVDAQDVGDDNALGYVAVLPNAQTWLYKIKVEDRVIVWPPAKMQLRLIRTSDVPVSQR